MEKYRNKYRISSARLRHWDYGSEALYYITICTQKRIHYFGEIVNPVETRRIASQQQPVELAKQTRRIASQQQQSLSEMKLSEIGKIVESEWLKTFELRPDMNLFMGEFVVMPNHFHAIIGIGENVYNTNRNTHGNRDAMRRVSTINDITVNQNHFGPQSKNLSSIIRGFKSSVTISARIINPKFQWQPRFYDHIIRTEESFQNISKYIINNPAKWREDRFLQ